MKAFLIRRYGGPQVLEEAEVPAPTPGPGELLLDVHAASVNPIDWKLRDGKTKAALPYEFPVILGHDVSGTVRAVGEGATRFKPGDAVYARLPDLHIGGFAEQVVVPERVAAAKAQSLSHVEAASIPLVGLTAWQALFEFGALKAGERVLIHGGAGGVGSLAVQLAKHHGAYVISTASAKNVDKVRGYGADEVIDYRSERFDEKVRDVDLVLDTMGGDTLMRSFRTVRTGARVVSISGPPDANFARRFGFAWPLRVGVALLSMSARRAAAKRGASYRYVFMHPDADGLAKLAELAQAGKLKPNVDRTFPFAQTKDAIAFAEAGSAQGKVVVEVRR